MPSPSTCWNLSKSEFDVGLLGVDVLCGNLRSLAAFLNCAAASEYRILAFGNSLDQCWIRWSTASIAFLVLQFPKLAKPEASSLATKPALMLPIPRPMVSVSMFAATPTPLVLALSRFLLDSIESKVVFSANFLAGILSSGFTTFA